jgi:(S)-2-hydroxy-acid oxidase
MAVRGEARACLGGRPVLYGLAAGGERGARQVVDMMRGELATAMALMGCASVGELTRSHIYRRADGSRATGDLRRA